MNDAHKSLQLSYDVILSVLTLSACLRVGGTLTPFITRKQWLS